MTQSVLSVRMDAKTKSAFSALCEEMGMSISTAVNVFARQTIKERKIPFSISAVAQTSDILTVPFIGKCVKAAAREYSSISKVVLFGSYARGEANEQSDIDHRLVYDKDGDFTLMRLAAFSHQIETSTGKQVDIVSKRTIDNKKLRIAIEEEGLVLYERES